MNRARRNLLGMALLGATGALLAARRRSGAALRLDVELAAIAADPACELASVSVLAIRAGQVSYAAQFGRRFIGHDGLPDQPVGPGTLFRIASVPKMMTTLGLLRLVEDGRLGLDAGVSGHLGFTLRNPHYPDQAITLRHLLAHGHNMNPGYARPLYIHWPGAGPAPKLLCMSQINSVHGCNK